MFNIGGVLMKKFIIIFSILIMSILISLCYWKTQDKVVTSSYEELDKLPQIYGFKLATKNSDVVKAKDINYNIEKLDKFIENYKNNKKDTINMIRITNYTAEGDAIICDLIISNEGIKLIQDNTRDKFSNKENRKKTEYKIVDIFKLNEYEGISYMVKTDKGEEKNIFFLNSK